MIYSIQVMYDQQDIAMLSAYYLSVGRKVARDEIIPILKRHLDPMVAEEKKYLAKHTKSGALISSLVSRSGSGDRPGTMSVFAAATATPKQLASTWGKSTKQKKGFTSNIRKKKGRRKVFYADFLEKGHRLVRKNSSGVARVVGKVPAYPFAQQAVDSIGDQQAEAAANEVLDHILG